MAFRPLLTTKNARLNSRPQPYQAGSPLGQSEGTRPLLVCRAGYSRPLHLIGGSAPIVSVPSDPSQSRKRPWGACGKTEQQARAGDSSNAPTGKEASRKGAPLGGRLPSYYRFERRPLGRSLAGMTPLELRMERSSLRSGPAHCLCTLPASIVEEAARVCENVGDWGPAHWVSPVARRRKTDKR
jgi:hypothetical protein